MEKNELICYRCSVPLEEKKVTFSYLGHNFFADMPCCPVCGQVYISKDAVRGKMAEVEKELEEK